MTHTGVHPSPAAAGEAPEAVDRNPEAAPDPDAIPDMVELLHEMIENDASDLHITAGVPPQVRVDGDLHGLPHPTLGANDTKLLLYSVMTEEQKTVLEDKLEIDFSFGIEDLARFRANVFIQRGAVAGALRFIPWGIPSFEELGLPEVVKEVCAQPRGLVLVTGPTGSGKSTTLAAMVDLINSTRAGHIITIEDPIEYLHSHKRSIVNQRELHADTRSFAAAMRSALREDPDVVLIGEMRDLESTGLALTLAETGHLTLATLHTNSAVQTINRIIDIFPSAQQPQIRTQLSFVLIASMSQALLPAARGKGRVLAQEILLPNAAIRNLIREDKVHQIASSMQTGQAEHGMKTFNQDLGRLVQSGKITRDTALLTTSDRRELLNILSRVDSPARPGRDRSKKAGRGRREGKRFR